MRSPTRRFGEVVVGALALACLAFQQSPANEALRTAAALEVLKQSSNELLVGGVVGVLTMVIEGITSVMIGLGLHLDHRIVLRLLGRAQRKQKPRSDRRVTSLATDFGITLAIGAGLVVVKRHVRQPGRTRRQDLTTGLGFALVAAAVSALIGFLAAGGITYADRVGLGTPAKYFVDYATDWRFWVVLVGGGYLISGAYKLIRHVRSRRGEPLETT